MQLVNHTVAQSPQGDLSTPASLTKALLAGVKSKDSDQSGIVIVASWVQIDGTRVCLEASGVSAVEASLDDIQAVTAAITSMGCEKADASAPELPHQEVHIVQAQLYAHRSRKNRTDVALTPRAHSDKIDDPQVPDGVCRLNDSQTRLGLTPACITHEVPVLGEKLVPSL